VQGRHGYAAIGRDGQVILVVAPGRRLIVVASSHVVGPKQGGDAIFGWSTWLSSRTCAEFVYFTRWDQSGPNL